MIFPSFSTFVERDYQILARRGKVISHRYRQGKNLRTHLRSQLYLFWKLLKTGRKADMFYCWFADYHSLLPTVFSRFLGIKMIVVVGGYDVLHLPEIGYGSLKNPLRKFCAYITLRYAWLNLAVSDFVRQRVEQLAKQARVITLYNGVDVENCPEIRPTKKPLVLTVGAGDTWQRIRLKGIDMFCQVAERVPECEFLAIGIGPDAEQYIRTRPANLHLMGRLPLPELFRHYQLASVYCQFSMVESFGLAVAEAMLCGCIPVVSHAGGLPEVVGDTGFIITPGEREEAIRAVKAAIRASGEARKKCRDRIIENFSLSARESRLVQLLELGAGT